MPRAPARKLMLLCALLTAGALLASVIAAGANGTGVTSHFDKRCKPPGSRLVAANRYARVYYANEGSSMAYCLPRSRLPAVTLDDVYPPPAISLNGPYLGYGYRFNEGVSGGEHVEVVDVRREDFVFIRDVTRSGVGSLKVNRRGSVAWIECPLFDVFEGRLSCNTGSPDAPTTAVRTVYRHDSRSTKEQPVQLLAQGPGIKLRSLRRKRSRIYWTEDGKTRGASLR